MYIYYPSTVFSENIPLNELELCRIRAESFKGFIDDPE